ncbi:hypothetical protein BC938DRAFT_475802 [Jimgerdemannia flammicorona]|uniref:Heat shock protein 70 family n=1 Tax=Jimgerdemannia flammicorona TaxID=994334 RepID=A0A433PNX0_9FUNG|nr:hypothetical protein BC938DRAFT_475802 [Jimgerdemannia flammicorona]
MPRNKTPRVKNTTAGVFHNILKRKPYSFICAIDFGTSGTGFCYAVSNNGTIDAKRDIIPNPDWESLRFIKKVFFEHLRKKNVSCSERDVFWVLTIPAIWDDAAKLLMRQAAVAAELEKEDGQLVLALEPEAASLWCLASGGISLKEKDIYVVIDCGGGTVDITIHEVERADERRPRVKEGMYSLSVVYSLHDFFWPV